VIIANLLHKLEVPYDYELPFAGDDGKVVRPDFTITTDLGETILWEHLGMLSDPRYAAKWAAKQNWYARNGVLPLADAGTAGWRATLVITDDLDGVDVPTWRRLAEQAVGAEPS
jgi:hypothetical protein